LVAIDEPTNTDFRAKIEGSFTRILKLTAADGRSYFEATYKMGKRHLFGQTAAHRVAGQENSRPGVLLQGEERLWGTAQKALLRPGSHSCHKI